MSSGITEDVKIMLRSVLVSSPGVKQSSLCKDYQDMIGETLTYLNMGFKNLYEFLKALEGEVTRLEFSSQLEDNVVYAVLDSSKFSSKHAVKNAVKYGTGVASKSPEEIKQWLLNTKGTVVGRTEQTNKKKNKVLSSLVRQGNNIKPIIQAPSPVRTELLPTMREFVLLNNLRPDRNGVFTLCVKNIGVSRNLTLAKRDLLTHFAPYSPLPTVSFLKDGGKNLAAISFGVYINAYKAWREKSNTICKGERIEAVPTSKFCDAAKNYYSVIVVYLPQSVLLTTLVTTFNQFPGLVNIEPHCKEWFVGFHHEDSFNECSATVYYTVEKSTADAVQNVKQITGMNHKTYAVEVKLIPRKPVLTPSSPGVSTHTQSNCNTSTNQPHSVVKKSYPVVFSPKQSQVKQQPAVDVVAVDTSQYDHLTCGFGLDYPNSYKMFQATCKRSPRTFKNVANEISFLVTFPVDLCRFWGMLIDKKKEQYNKLLKLESELEKKATKTLPPTVLPKSGVRGAALYPENDTWYRCWVMTADVEKDQVTVFFCDYGNVETIQREKFRSTYSDSWSLPPLAIPCVMYGYESCLSDVDGDFYRKGNERLLTLVVGNLLHAEVVKTANRSQPHIIELKNIYVANNKTDSIEDIMEKEGYLQKIHQSHSVQPVDPVEARASTENKYIPSESTLNTPNEPVGTADENDEVGADDTLYDYDKEQLAVGMISAVHQPQLIYLHLGTLEGLQEVHNQLECLQPLPCGVIEVGSILMLLRSNERRRVLVLQVHEKKAKVLHTDFGIIEKVLCEELFKISDELSDYPLQARPAMLAGVECNDDSSKQNVIGYLKSKVREPIRCNIIEESEIGKITVELLEMNSNKSINTTLISLGYATQNVTHKSGNNSEVDMETGNDNDSVCTANQTMSRSCDNNVVGAARKVSTVSNASWESNRSLFKPSPSRIVNNALQGIPAKDSICIDSWLEKTVNTPPEDHHRPSSPSYPPPDIVTSTNPSGCVLREDVHVEENRVVIGTDPDRLEFLKLDPEKNVDNAAVDALRFNWHDEISTLLAIKTKLEGLMKLDTTDLNLIYKERKLEKLRLKLRVKDLEKKINLLRLEYETVNDETEKVLANI